MEVFKLMYDNKKIDYNQWSSIIRIMREQNGWIYHYWLIKQES